MMQNIRTFRAPVANIGIRQRVASGREEVFSENLVRPMVMILLAAITIVFTMSQFLHWRIESNSATLDQLQAVRRNVGSENISLLAARARLMSASNVEAYAAARLQLYRPEKGQQHRL